MDDKKILRNFIKELEEKGIKLSLNNGNIVYTSKNQKLQADEIDLMKKYKSQIIEILETGYNSETSYRDCFPVTDIQAAYILGQSSSFQYGGVSCHVYMGLKYDDINRNRCENIWNCLIQRHPMMRAVFSKEGMQYIKENVPVYKIREVDSEMSPLLVEELSNKKYEIGKWPLFDIAISNHKGYKILHISIDFLIADWTSIWILIDEYEQLYYGEGVILDRLSYTFKEYILSIYDKKGKKYLIDKEYWENRVKHMPYAPRLPMIEESNRINRFIRKTGQLSCEEWKNIEETAKNYGVTATCVLLTVYALCLSKWSSPDFSLNLTMLNRPNINDEIHKIVGDFTSVDILEVHLGYREIFIDQIKMIQRQLFSDLDHMEFNGVNVIREIGHVKGENILIPYVFTSSLGIKKAGKARGIIMPDGISQTPQVYIDCQIMDIEGKLQYNWDIREGIFSPEIIEPLFSSFCNTVKKIAKNKNWERPIRNLIELPNMQIEARKKANTTEKKFENAELLSQIWENLDSNDANIAIIDATGEYSYTQLKEKIYEIAAYIYEHNYKKGTRIAIMMDGSFLAAAAILATVMMGNVYVPIDGEQPTLRIMTMLEKGGVQCILCESESIEAEYSPKISTCNIKKLNGKKKYYGVRESIIEPENEMYIIFTSGSTGEPKGVLITHQAAANTILDVCDRFSVQREDTILGISKLSFDLSVYDLFGILYMGGKVVYPDSKKRLDMEFISHLLIKYQINSWNSVPALFKMLVEYVETHKEMYGLELKNVFLSGDWIAINSVWKAMSNMRIENLVSMGGATEAAIWSIYHIIQSEDLNRKSIPYGYPLSNQKVYVLDSQLNIRPDWVTGELYIAGKGLALEYVSNKEKTRESFIYHPESGERLYKTGDLGRYMPNGEIEFIGRKDSQVKVNGYRIELGEIENMASTCKGVEGTCAFVENLENDKKQVSIVLTATKQEEGLECIERGYETVFEIKNAIEEEIKRQKDKAYFRAMVLCDENSVAQAVKEAISLETCAYDFVVMGNEIDNIAVTEIENLDVPIIFWKDIQNYREIGLHPNSYQIIVDCRENLKSEETLEELVRPKGIIFLLNSRERKMKEVKRTKSNIIIEQFLHELRKKIPEYMIPATVQVVDRLPLTENGKVNRKAIAKWKIGMPTKINRKKRNTLGNGELAERIRSIWQETLKVEHIEVESNVYEYGANSLLIAQAAGKIRDLYTGAMPNNELSFDFVLQNILSNPTINMMAENIENIINENVKESTEKMTTYYSQEPGVFRALFHSAAGHSIQYRNLVEILRKQHKGSVAVISLKNVEEYCALPPDRLVNILAKRYAEEILSCNVKKIQIAGYCLGGAIALEVAKILETEGVEIIDVTLIDTYAIPFNVENEIIIELIYLWIMSINYSVVNPEIDDQQVINAILHIIKMNNSNIPHEIHKFLENNEFIQVNKWISELEEIPVRQRFEYYMKNAKTNETKEFLWDVFLMYRISIFASNFKLTHYSGKTRFLMAETPNIFFQTGQEENIEYWKKICVGKFEVIKIHGNHTTCLTEKRNAEEVGKILAIPLEENNYD